MRKNGFTLIELIAVIVILAIITLIAIPVITGLVDKSKKGAAEASALNYIDAVEKYNMLHDVNPTKYPYDLKDNTFNVSSNTEISLLDIIIPKAKAEGSIPSLNSFITVKGDKPKSGTVTIDKKGKVTEANIEINGYTVECTGSSCEAKGGNTPKVTLKINPLETTNVNVSTQTTLTVDTNSNEKVTWTSSDNTIATVTDGVVTGIKSGNVTITASIGNVTDSINLTIKGGPTLVPAKAGETHKGIVYLNPKNLNDYCDQNNSVSTTDTKDGCMKWYIFDDSDSKYKMILDHNSTALIVWNLKSTNIPYESTLIPGTIASYGWDSTLAVRLPTIYEINKMVGYTSSWDITNGPLYYISNIDRTKYSWLYDYTYQCLNYNCTIEDNNEYIKVGKDYSSNVNGYWTSSPRNGNQQGWSVRGTTTQITYSDYGNGIRPVIEVDKNIFN